MLGMLRNGGSTKPAKSYKHLMRRRHKRAKLEKYFGSTMLGMVLMLAFCAMVPQGYQSFFGVSLSGGHETKSPGLTRSLLSTDGFTLVEPEFMTHGRKLQGVTTVECGVEIYVR